MISDKVMALGKAIERLNATSRAQYYTVKRVTLHKAASSSNYTKYLCDITSRLLYSTVKEYQNPLRDETHNNVTQQCSLDQNNCAAWLHGAVRIACFSHPDIKTTGQMLSVGVM